MEMLFLLIEGPAVLDRDALLLLQLSEFAARKGICTTRKTTNDDDKRVVRRIMSYV